MRLEDDWVEWANWMESTKIGRVHKDRWVGSIAESIVAC